jgi:hypothetical protein
MSVIVAKGSGYYDTIMVGAVLRLLALVALIVMPIGMAGTPALAQSTDHAMATGHFMPAGHCGDERVPDKAPAKMDCTAACTALPGSATPMPTPLFKPKILRTITISAPFVDIEPEIATPPPRLD